MEYKVHFTDAYGQGCIECDETTYTDVMSALNADPHAEDIWVESYDPVEGYWQA